MKFVRFERIEKKTNINRKIIIQDLVRKTLEKLQESKRPVLYVGNGVRLSNAEEKFLRMVKMLKIPVLTSYAGYDLLPSDNKYFYGRAHAFGQRAANFVLQNSDFSFHS